MTSVPLRCVTYSPGRSRELAACARPNTNCLWPQWRHGGANRPPAGRLPTCPASCTRRRLLSDVCVPGQVNYRESISREADIHYTHKKQSGGAGQYADISVRFEPGEPGSGFTFRSDIKGGAVSLLLLAAAPPRDAGGVGSGGSRAWLGPTCQGRL